MGFRRFCIGPLLVVLLAVIPGRHALAETYAAQDVKAVFIFHFAKFITRPEAVPERSLVIGLLGEHAFDPTIRQLKAKPTPLHPVAFRPVRTLAEARQCDLLFISSSEKNRLDGWLAALRALPVLTVSDLPGFVDRGGMLEMIEIDRRIRFAVNLDELHAAGLTLDAQVLNLAYRVRHQPGEN